MGNIWSSDLGDMQLISMYNKGISFYCLVDFYSISARVRVISLKDKRF